MSNFSVVDGDIRLTTSGGGQLLHTDDQNRLKVVMDMVYVSHTLSGTDHIGQLSDDQVMVSNVTQHESYIDHNNLTNYLVAEHRTINDGGAASTDLWSASKISSEIASSSGTTDHSALDNLDYASAGHTGFSPASHLHDDRYYTESEINTISGSLSTEIDSDISTHTALSDAHHAESHTVASHSDTTATGAELDELTDGSIGDSLHLHNDGENILINQDFTCWQEGTTFTNPANNVYTADGYHVFNVAGGGTSPTINVKKNTSVYETAFEQSCELEITNVGSTGATRSWGYAQKIEDYKKYRGKTVTFSVRIKASVAITLPGRLTIYDGVSAGDFHITSIGTTWTTYSLTYTVNNSAASLILYFLVVKNAGVISTTGSIYIQYMKLELGSVATPLIPRSNAEEYLLCGTVIAPLNRTNPSVRFEDDAGNLGIEIVDGGKVNLANGTGINEFSTDGTLAGDSDDAVPTEKAVKTYSATVSGSLQSNIDGKSDTSHNHNLNDLSEKSYNSLTDTPTIPTDFYSQAEVDTISGSLSTEIDSDISTHSSSADHDDRYYTESEIDTISGSLSTEIDSDISTHSSSSDHDDRYYTESEINTISGSLQTNIDSKPDTLLELTDTPSNYDSDKYLKSTIDGTEWATVSGGGGADHNIADHLDTSATGAELNTLTDNSIADTLHRHSELVASDGSPDPALSVDSDGLISTNGAGIRVNSLGSGNRIAYLNLVGDDTYTDYGLRIHRGGTGANTGTEIYHRGTGSFQLWTQEAAPIIFLTNNNVRMTIASTGNVSLTNGTGINEFSTDGTLAGDSDDAVPTEKAVKTYSATISGSLQTNIDGKPDTLLELTDTPESYANGLYLKSTADGTEWATASGGGGVENHSALNELDYSSAGHTGFSSDTHLHDDRYYTESEVDTISGSLQSNIDGKADTSHNHTASDVTDFSEATDDRVSNLLIAGDNISLDYDDGAGTLTISGSAGGVENHSALNELDYASAGHTGFAPTNSYETVYIDAAEMIPCTTSGALQGTYEYGTNDIDVDYFAFDGGVTEERVQFKFKMHENWDRLTILAKFDWSTAIGSTSGDTVEWGIKAGSLSDGDTIDAVLGTPQVISDTLLADNGVYIQTSVKTPTITVGGTPVLGDMLIFEVYRNTDGADTCAEDAWLFGLTIQYKKSGSAVVW